LRDLFIYSDKNASSAVLLLGFAVLIAFLSLPLFYEKIPPNWFYGFRIPRAFEYEDNWYRINKYIARRMLQVSIILCVSGGACLFVAQPLNRLVAVGLLMICACLAIIDSLRYASYL
jgi:SdpI/YfhL protein family